jgi:hypothetical protein
VERRKEPRVDLNIPITLGIHQWTGDGAFQGQAIEGFLMDLSENGICLHVKTPLAEDMFVVIRLPEDSDLPTINARIIRVDLIEEGYEYGCLLLGTPIYIRNQLESYIDKRLA